MKVSNTNSKNLMMHLLTHFGVKLGLILISCVLNYLPALALKGVEYDTHPVHLVKDGGQQVTESLGIFSTGFDHTLYQGIAVALSRKN